uniref:Uncharacterized protein n=1 Tax=Cacopsylla melanoneura TaxID=428564 RepID=A0A8D9EX75_9HEMI
MKTSSVLTWMRIRTTSTRSGAKWPISIIRRGMILFSVAGIQMTWRIQRETSPSFSTKLGLGIDVELSPLCYMIGAVAMMRMNLCLNDLVWSLAHTCLTN